MMPAEKMFAGPYEKPSEPSYDSPGRLESLKMFAQKSREEQARKEKEEELKIERESRSIES